MNRRAFVAGTGAVLLAAPLAAEAQPAGKPPRIGLLTSSVVHAKNVAEAQPAEKVWRIGVLGTNPPTAALSFQAFRKALQELGYVEGQHVHIDFRWPEGERGGNPALAAQLVQGRPDVILTISAGAARAAKEATDTVPIVFCAMGDDPVQLGMVASLARPGGNVTGTVTLSRELEAKRLELLKEAVPSLSRAAVLWNASLPWHPRTLQDLEEAARRLNIRVIPVEFIGPGDIAKAFQLARQERGGGVLALASPETWRARANRPGRPRASPADGRE